MYMQSLSCPSAAIPPAAHCTALRGALSEDDSNLPGGRGGEDMISLTGSMGAACHYDFKKASWALRVTLHPLLSWL